MAKGESNQPDKIAEAIRELAKAVRDNQRDKAVERLFEKRKTQANNLMGLMNLVAVGMIIDQALARKVDLGVAVVGVAIVWVGYYISDRLMKGGDNL